MAADLVKVSESDVSVDCARNDESYLSCCAARSLLLILSYFRGSPRDDMNKMTCAWKIRFCFVSCNFQCHL